MVDREDHGEAPKRGYESPYAPPNPTGSPNAELVFEGEPSPPFPKIRRMIGAFLGAVEQRRSATVIFGIAFQMIVLIVLAAPYVFAIVDRDSRTVLLRVEPVDPRDLLRGDYVTLGLEVARMDGVPIPSRNGANRFDPGIGLPIYVFLTPEPDNLHYKRASITNERPRPGSGLYLEGTTSNWRRIVFGLESFFVQEGKGLEYEEAARRHHLSAEVTISPEGKGVLRRLIVEE